MMKDSAETPRKPKLTDTERHRRFVEMAHKLGIPDNADLSPEFFKNLVKAKRSVDPEKSSKK